MNDITYTTDAEFKTLVDVGLKDAEEGRTISHEEMKQRMAQWRGAFGIPVVEGTGTYPARLKWTSDLYSRLVDTGIFGDCPKFELIGGEILIEGMRDRFKMTPQYCWAVSNAMSKLREAFGDGYSVRQFGTLSLLEGCYPEPDVAVVDGSWKDNLETHPTGALLVVEIASATLEFDRHYKASLYASVRIADYWIINIPDCRLEVYRVPVLDETSRFGYRYSEVTVLGAGDTITPLAAPGASIDVAPLLP